MLSPMSGIVCFINTFRNLMLYIHYVDRDNELLSSSVNVGRENNNDIISPSDIIPKFGLLQ